MEIWSTVFDDGGKCLYFVSVYDQLINGYTMLTERNAITIHIAFFTILKKKSLKIQIQLQCTWYHSCSIFFFQWWPTGGFRQWRAFQIRVCDRCVISAPCNSLEDRRVIVLRLVKKFCQKHWYYIHCIRIKDWSWKQCWYLSHHVVEKLQTGEELITNKVGF